MNKRFAVFDIDGTLIRWQLYHALVDQLAKMNLINQNLYENLKKSRMKWKNRESDKSFKEYEQNLIDIFENSLTDISPQQLESAAKIVVKTYSRQTYTFTRDLATKLKEKDYKLIAISGSHQELVKQIAKHYNFDLWVGTEYIRDGNRFTGNKKIGSHDKKGTLLEIIKTNKLSLQDSYAIGDSFSDSGMLELVSRPIAFNPDKQLYAKARQLHWDIVIERKNVIYQLKYIGGKYVLA